MVRVEMVAAQIRKKVAADEAADVSVEYNNLDLI